MKVFFYIIITLLSFVIWAQEDSLLKNTYFNFYPIELLAGQPRVGFEYELKPNMLFVLIVNVFWRRFVL
jgi:hypothetical protein